MRIIENYLQEGGNDLIVFDELESHWNDDPKSVLNKWITAFKDLESKNHLTGAGEATLQRLENVKDNFEGEDSTFSVGDINFNSEDVTGPGLEYAKDKYNDGI